jgi:hypothetical protein
MFSDIYIMLPDLASCYFIVTPPARRRSGVLKWVSLLSLSSSTVSQTGSLINGFICVHHYDFVAFVYICR